jgi:hypothetical protein
MASSATDDSICGLGYKLSDTRADILVGQGNILKNAGDNTSAILRDANGNALMTNANIDRSSATGLQEMNRGNDKIGNQADTIAWNKLAIQNASFGESRAQIERVNDAQSAYADRASKHLSQSLNDSFARLSAQGENGFARGSAQSENGFSRQLLATNAADKQVVQSEIGVTRSVHAGFAEGSIAAAANYASLSQQNCNTKEAMAAYGNRSSDQSAALFAGFTNQHTDMTRDLMGVSRDLLNQGVINAAATQLESAKNTIALQLQVSNNSKESVLQAAVIAKDLGIQSSFLAKESLLEQSKWFALAEKTAMVNRCDLEAKMAACCCEIKESVLVTSNATQSLIQNNESSRVRDALSAAVAENSILRLRREERGPAHYPVPYPYPYPHHHQRCESPRREGRDGRD